MKITELAVEIKRRSKPRAPISDAIQILDHPGSVRVTVTTDDGITGEGECSLGRVGGALETLKALIQHELRPIVVGQDPAYVREIHGRMIRETEYHGYTGLAMFGISAVDTAIWDCLGRTHGVPCWQLWGGVHRRIPAYAMVGWLGYDNAEVQRTCAQAVEQGFRAVKMKVGYPTLAEDLRRIQVVREAIGADIDLMVDANQSLSTAEAMVRGRAFERLGLKWWEEPIPADDVDGYAALAAALDIPIATGENLYSPAEVARFLRRDAVDILQPDLRRGGGPTALLQMGLLADAFRRPYASHGGGPVQLNVMAALPNAMYLETGLIGPDSRLEMKDGCVGVPTGPGFSWG